ncbi:hypothetical protein A3Q56_07187 [Intoshia linei]|uniref:Uncharacterized protein n=1 Tax=Intoshia linei TaxID=1819745 RepID=A0A177ASY0_9BILA|nr:hypothetical protein A3Q56_07187 [Intoshia linei]
MFKVQDQSEIPNCQLDFGTSIFWNSLSISTTKERMLYSVAHSWINKDEKSGFVVLRYTTLDNYNEDTNLTSYYTLRRIYQHIILGLKLSKEIVYQTENEPFFTNVKSFDQLYNISTSTYHLTTKLYELLENFPQSHKLVLLIDDGDFLLCQSDLNMCFEKWLPTNLSNNVKVIITCSIERNMNRSHRLITHYRENDNLYKTFCLKIGEHVENFKKSFKYINQSILEKLDNYIAEKTMFTFETISVMTCLNFLMSILESDNRILQVDQKNGLIDILSINRNPFFVQVMSHKLKKLEISKEISFETFGLLNKTGDISSKLIIENILDDFENEYGKILIRAIFSYLCLSPLGYNEIEFINILCNDSEIISVFMEEKLDESLRDSNMSEAVSIYVDCAHFESELSTKKAIHLRLISTFIVFCMQNIVQFFIKRRIRHSTTSIFLSNTTVLEIVANRYLSNTKIRYAYNDKICKYYTLKMKSLKENINKEMKNSSDVPNESISTFDDYSNQYERKVDGMSQSMKTKGTMNIENYITSILLPRKYPEQTKDLKIRNLYRKLIRVYDVLIKHLCVGKKYNLLNRMVIMNYQVLNDRIKYGAPICYIIYDYLMLKIKKQFNIVSDVIIKRLSFNEIQFSMNGKMLSIKILGELWKKCISSTLQNVIIEKFFNECLLDENVYMVATCSEFSYSMEFILDKIYLYKNEISNKSSEINSKNFQIQDNQLYYKHHDEKSIYKVETCANNCNHKKIFSSKKLDEEFCVGFLYCTPNKEHFIFYDEKNVMMKIYKSETGKFLQNIFLKTFLESRVFNFNLFNCKLDTKDQEMELNGKTKKSKKNENDKTLVIVTNISVSNNHVALCLNTYMEKCLIIVSISHYAEMANDSQTPQTNQKFKNSQESLLEVTSNSDAELDNQYGISKKIKFSESINYIAYTFSLNGNEIIFYDNDKLYLFELKTCQIISELCINHIKPQIIYSLSHDTFLMIEKYYIYVIDKVGLESNLVIKHKIKITNYLNSDSEQSFDTFCRKVVTNRFCKYFNISIGTDIILIKKNRYKKIKVLSAPIFIQNHYNTKICQEFNNYQLDHFKIVNDDYHVRRSCCFRHILWLHDYNNIVSCIGIYIVVWNVAKCNVQQIIPFISYGYITHLSNAYKDNSSFIVATNVSKGKLYLCRISKQENLSVPYPSKMKIEKHAEKVIQYNINTFNHLHHFQSKIIKIELCSIPNIVLAQLENNDQLFFINMNNNKITKTVKMFQPGYFSLSANARYICTSFVDHKTPFTTHLTEMNKCCLNFDTNYSCIESQVCIKEASKNVKKILPFYLEDSFILVENNPIRIEIVRLINTMEDNKIALYTCQFPKESKFQNLNSTNVDYIPKKIEYSYKKLKIRGNLRMYNVVANVNSSFITKDDKYLVIIVNWTCKEDDFRNISSINPLNSFNNYDSIETYSIEYINNSPYKGILKQNRKISNIRGSSYKISHFIDKTVLLNWAITNETKPPRILDVRHHPISNDKMLVLYNDTILSVGMAIVCNTTGEIEKKVLNLSNSCNLNCLLFNNSLSYCIDQNLAIIELDNNKYLRNIDPMLFKKNFIPKNGSNSQISRNTNTPYKSIFREDDHLILNFIIGNDFAILNDSQRIFVYSIKNDKIVQKFALSFPISSITYVKNDVTQIVNASIKNVSEKHENVQVHMIYVCCVNGTIKSLIFYRDSSQYDLFGENNHLDSRKKIYLKLFNTLQYANIN